MAGTNPTASTSNTQPVGYLVAKHTGFVVICHECSVQGVFGSEFRTLIYRVNIYPYRATCNVCKKTLVEPQSPAWPELFTGGAR